MEICEHLKVILEHEESIGNRLIEKSEGWSKVKLVVTLDKCIDLVFAKEIIDSGVKLRIWENKDSHYPNQKGLTCDQCGQSIAGPL